VNCPVCSNQIMFGTKTCECGYRPDSAERSEDDRSIDLSYLEALRAFWRIYWPMQLTMAIGFVVSTGTPIDTLVRLVLWGAALYFVVGRLVSRPYKGFFILVLSSADGQVSRHLTARRRLDVWAYLLWRLVVAEVLASILTVPTNMVLGIMGIKAAGWLSVAGFVLVSGPILLKMLIGEPFDGFMLIARRRSDVNTAAEPLAQTAE
jgi:hypothetical protein